MALRLRPMEVPAVHRFLEASTRDYIEERVANGEPREVAVAAAATSDVASLPGGLPAPGHRFYDVIDTDEVVGELWIGPAPSRGPTSAWIYSVEVVASRRGEGLGRAIMGLAELDACHHGCTELGLNVFGNNLVARRLYESLGYQPISIQMTKDVRAPDVTAPAPEVSDAGPGEPGP